MVEHRRSLAGLSLLATGALALSACGGHHHNQQNQVEQRAKQQRAYLPIPDGLRGYPKVAPSLKRAQARWC